MSRDFLVGDASSIEPYDLISGGDSCYACHVDIQFHGSNRRGWESCCFSFLPTSGWIWSVWMVS